MLLEILLPLHRSLFKFRLLLLNKLGDLSGGLNKRLSIIKRKLKKNKINLTLTVSTITDNLCITSAGFESSKVRSRISRAFLFFPDPVSLLGVEAGTLGIAGMPFSFLTIAEVPEITSRKSA
jgi:hypothetical protein